MPDKPDPPPPPPPPAAPSKKKKKPKKKAPPPPLPTLAAAADWLPFRLAFTARLGRHAVAAKPLAPGDLILVEAPVAAVPRARHAGAACPGCAVGVCGGGGRYCGPACAARHAPRRALAGPGRAAAAAVAAAHAAPASSAAGLGAEDLGDLLAMVAELDAARAVEEEGAKEGAGGGACGGGGHVHTDACGHHAAAPADAPVDACGHNHGAVNLNDAASDPRWPLRCGAADVAALSRGGAKREAGWRTQMAAAAAGLADAIKAGGTYAPPPPAALADLADVVATNAHGTGAGDPSSSDLGFALFPALAMLNHACAPNAAFAVTGGVVRARAIRDIREGEPLTLSYVNLYEPRRTRAAQLAESKQFVCGCERCAGPLASARDARLEGVPCRARGGACGGCYLPSDADVGADWTCDRCGKTVPASAPDGGGPADVTARAAAALDAAFRVQADRGPAAAAPGLRAVVDLAPSTLHEHNVVVFDALMPLANAARRAGDLATATRCVASLIGAMDALVGLPTAELGNLCELQADLLAARADAAPPALAARLRRGAADAAARALKTRAVVLGGAHPLTRESEAQVERVRRGG